MRAAGPLTGLLLAAGAARRFGANKLLATLPDGQSVGLVAAARLAAVVDRLLVVVRSGDAATAASFARAGYSVIEAANAARGMAHSLAAGVAASPDAAAWMIALADMPRVAPATLTCLVERWRAQDAIVVPTCDGRRGHPVIFPARYGPELRALEGDQGARTVLAAHALEVVLAETGDRGVLVDVDTPADLAGLD